MSDYKEQVNSLREHANLIETYGTELYGPSAARLLVYDLRNAAAAIEELQADNAAIQGELDALRVFTDEAQRHIEELQAGVERLQAQLPKRGEWVGVSPMVDTVQCSVCGGELFSAELETPYCPYCGAKMIGEQNVE